MKILKHVFLFFLIIHTYHDIAFADDNNGGKGKNVVKRADLPRLELAGGLFFFRLHDYRGSDQFHSYYWPIPYINYRGKYVDVENSLVKGHLYENGRFRVTLSLMGSVRVNSKKNHAREGMPALDPTFEIGPAAAYDIWVGDEGKKYSSVGLILRSAHFAEFFYVHHMGYFTVPYIAYTLLPQKNTLKSFIQFSAAAMFATQKYHAYFYDVASEHATRDRPYYRSKGGYSGWHTTFYISKKSHPFYFFLFGRYDRLKGTAFEDSPLVKKRDYVAMGGGIIWYFYKSKELALERRIEK